ncbi:MAG: asparagine synthase (glutamine-hydrolyzing), partial [Myxococcota bacterium]|nr:asparagine synthase (glutamine-hydrolyzing) [Myxococcota bacterium]
MCGIAGVLARGSVEEPVLAAMAAALRHRGPDGEGTWRGEPFEADGARWQLGLAHTRLAVFDPGLAGAQPMRSRSGRTVVVFNGEIYNHPELRRRLPGFPWRTRTDTEVLLELLEAFGPDVLHAANGMFALAWFDRASRRLWIARDRLGVKPVYVRAGREGVVFGSELPAVLAGPGFPRRVDPEALSAYLDFGFVPAPRTLVDGVAKLPPGGLFEWHGGRSRTRRWWTPPRPARAGGSDAGWRERLHGGLVDAVRLRLRSDVPVGTFLSGGFDSTLVTALAARERPGLPSFSVRFPESSALDESRHARAAARVLGTRHTEVVVTGDDVEAALPGLLARLDEPFADSSLLPVHFLSRAARVSVTVALSGDGADELFAGYRRYAAERWLARWRRVPGPARRAVLAPLLRGLGEERGTRRGELGRRARKVLDTEGLPPEARALAVARIFRDAEKARLLGEAGEATRDVSLELLRALRARERGRDELDTRLRVDLALGLPDDMLTKVDRASMAHGLEVRVPFLDPRVVETALALPSDLKLGAGRGK